MRELREKLYFKLVLGVIFALATATNVFAGANSSGGGPTIVTYDGGRVSTAAILDLYEGQIRFGLTIPQTALPVQQQLDQAVLKLSLTYPTIASDVKESLLYIQSHQSFLPLGVVMAPGIDLGDSYAAVIPEGSQLQYVGYYEASGTLKISQTIFNKLSETDQAAFFMHEALYQVTRLFSDADNSAEARMINAYLFSTTTDLSPLQDVARDFMWGGAYNGHGMDDVTMLSGTAGAFTIKVTKSGPEAITVSYGCAKIADTTSGYLEQSSFSHVMTLNQDSFTLNEQIGAERCKAVYVDIDSMNDFQATRPSVEINYGSQFLIRKDSDVTGRHVPHIFIPVYH